MADGRAFALQLRIGTFILAGLLVFLAIIYLLGAQARYFERKYDLIAEFSEVGGLIEGATVRLAGVQIGRVTNVTLPPEPGGKVKVTLTIARRFADRIRRDSEARIVTQGLLGDKLVEITIGTAGAPVLPPGAHLAATEPFEISSETGPSTRSASWRGRSASPSRSSTGTAPSTISGPP
jgi:phospholipid/cholesterol/gamma-HCH transport system substrate-binding protein